MSQHVDLILTAAIVHTLQDVDEAIPVTAIAIADGSVVAVGSSADADELG